jgi:hypothetical protein
MQKILFLTIGLLSILTSCKKKSQDNPILVNTISASVDGVKSTFNTKAGAWQSKVAGTNVLVIVGEESTDVNSGLIKLEIDTSSIITEGTYFMKVGIPNGFYSGTTISYVQGYATLYPSLSTNPPNSITISHINSTSVQGTFNVSLFGGLAGVTESKTITNGSFNVSISH